MGIGKRNESIIPKTAKPTNVCIAVKSIVNSNPIIVKGGIATMGLPLTGKTQSEAQLNVAKAQDLTELDPQIQIAKLQAEIQMKREELELRRQLSADTNDMRRGQSDTQAAVKMATTAIKQ